MKKYKNSFILILFVFLIGCASSHPPVNLYDVPHSCLDITDKKSSVNLVNYKPDPLEKRKREIRYQTVEFKELLFGINIKCKWDKDLRYDIFKHTPPLPPCYQIRMLFENKTDAILSIEPLITLTDNHDLVINSYDPKLLLQPASKISGKSESEIAEIFSNRPSKPTFKFDNSSDILENVNSYLEEENEYRRQEAKYSTNLMFAMMEEKEKELADAYIQYISTNWIAHKYSIPPRSKIVSVIYFPNDNNSVPVDIRVNINGQELNFKSGKFYDDFFIVLNNGKIVENILPIRFVDFSSNRKQFLFYDQDFEEHWIDIFMLKEFHGWNKKWYFTGNAKERWQTINEIYNTFVGENR